MKGNKATVLTFAEKCKTILTSNWQGQLNTVKADAKGSKQDVYTSKVKYIIKRGKPYIWVPEKDPHNVNTILDERGSFSVASPFPGPLSTLFKSLKKLPARVALTGDVVPLKTERAQSASETLEEVIQTEQNAINESTYAVSSILRSSIHTSASRSKNLKELLDGENYMVYKFNPSACIFLDSHGGTHEIELEDIVTSKADPLAPLSAMLVDGINQSEARRRALVLFCSVYMNANARDALMLAVDRNGFDVVGKVPGGVTNEGDVEYQWKEYRFRFKEEVCDVESFCSQLVTMEDEAIKMVTSSSGIV